MSGKLSRKERAKLQSEQHKSVQTPESAPSRAKRVTPPVQRLKDSDLVRRLNIILIILAAGVYFNSLFNEYALDDYGLILENTQTTRGTDALGDIFTSAYRAGTFNGDNSLYRPLSKMMFAVEWSIADGAPWLGHFMNVALFSLSIVLLFRMLRRYLKDNITVPFITAVLFAVHPIHTEVVANIKGRDDILCFLFFVCTALYVHRFAVQRKMKDLVLAGVMFFLCTISKESAITFVAVIPLMLYFFTDAGREVYKKVGITVGAVALLFLAIRTLVLQGGGTVSAPEVDNYIAGIDGFFAQRATAIAITGIYLVKLFVPYSLVSDASWPQLPVYGFGSWEFLVSLVVLLAMLVFAVLKFKSRHPVSFGILYFFITFSIVSNIPFLIGTNYAERLLYTPSLGIFLAVAWAVHHFLGESEQHLNTLGEYLSAQKKVLGVLAVPVFLYAGIAVMRNPVWKDNDTLYSTDVLISENSCKTHFFYGNHLTMNDSLAAHAADTAEWSRRVNIGLAEFRTAIALNPEYAEATQRLGEMFFHKKQYDSSEVYYRKAIELTPKMATYRNNFGRMLFSIGRYDEAQQEFEEAIRLNPYYSTAYNNLAGCYGMQGSQYVLQMQNDTLRSAEHQQKAIELYQKSIATSLQAIKYDPLFINAYETTAQTYKNLGDAENAKNYQAQAQALVQNGTGHR